jgi:pSer/pThr/pTyr-binding forkhead associated (FHA) protein
MYCPECGHHNREGARFCGRCGASLLDGDAGEQPTEALPAIEAAAAEEEPASVDAGTLVIRLGGGRAGEQFAVRSDVTTIGRAPQSDVFLDDITVSRAHARLERTPNGPQLTDLGSLNGTYVNRERIETVRLFDGDELQVGKYRLTYIEKSLDG